MRQLTASELIGVWERGVGEHPVQRALTLLEAWSGSPREKLACFSIGTRDGQLAELYESLFGPKLHGFAECPKCAERFEYSVTTQNLNLPSDSKGEEDLKLMSGAISLRLRLLNSLDLDAVRDCGDPAVARRLLGERCVMEASQDGAVVAAQALPDSAIDQIAACLADADPLSETLIELTCSACHHTWQTILDIEGFLWTKIATLAKRLLQEVHLLARAYGWSETEILGLSTARRQFYLRMVRDNV